METPGQARTIANWYSISQPINHESNDTFEKLTIFVCTNPFTTMKLSSLLWVKGAAQKLADLKG